MSLGVGDWMKLQCGDRVIEDGGRHEGRVEQIRNSDVVTVRWLDTGWLSEFRLGDGDLENLTRYRRRG
jgi:hypothetical protein